MRKYFIAAIFLSLILAHPGACISRVRLDKTNLPHYAPGEILVKFKQAASRSDIAQLNTKLGSKTMKTFPSIGVHRIRLKPGDTVSEAIEKYASDPNVEYAEPNYIVHTCQTFPSDTDFGLLWGLNNAWDADIDAPEAWDFTTGSPNIIIAVTDTGVNYNHTDLAANMWTNPGEDPWTDPADPTTGNGKDDDKNGYIDDWRGWDFLGHEDHILSPGVMIPDNDPMDQSDHGSHVAGTIAAVGNNANGITGVMWTARIMPVRFLNGQGGLYSDAIEAVNYAAMMGAHIINASWGGYYYSQALYDAIASSGVLFVAAAGNENNDNDGDFKLYPASYDLPNIISVAATDLNDLLAGFSYYGSSGSNYGATSVDVGAPGVGIYSSTLLRTTVFYDNMEAGGGNWVSDTIPPNNPNVHTWVLNDITIDPQNPDYSGPYAIGNRSLTDSPQGPPDPGDTGWNYEPDTNSWVGLFSAIDLVGRFGTKLIFYIRHNLDYEE